MPRAQRRRHAHNGLTLLLAVALLGACITILLLLLAWPAKKDCPMPIPEQYHAKPPVWV